MEVCASCVAISHTLGPNLKPDQMFRENCGRQGMPSQSLRSSNTFTNCLVSTSRNTASHRFTALRALSLKERRVNDHRSSFRLCCVSLYALACRNLWSLRQVPRRRLRQICVENGQNQHYVILDPSQATPALQRPMQTFGAFSLAGTVTAVPRKTALDQDLNGKGAVRDVSKDPQKRIKTRCFCSSMPFLSPINQSQL